MAKNFIILLQVPLVGVLLNNESKLEDMATIMFQLHQYIPA